MTEDNGLRRKGLLVRLRFATDDRLVASVRQGDPIAFEALYERHVSELLSFCVYMLGSRQDAEDAVQATFASAYRALRADERRITLRPWLFTIARNESLSILRSRRPTVELNGEPALGGDPLRELEVREEVRHVMEDLSKLPENQRAALVLAEMHGLSQTQIGTVLGVRPGQVKAYIFQARSNLMSERRAREIDCQQIREELANARGAALLRGRLRRHLRSCQDCRVYADGVARQRRQLSALLPLAPSLVLKSRALRYVLESGAAVDPAPYAGGAAVTAGSVVGAAVELAGGGAKAVGLKLATGVACLCASVGVGASVLGSHEGGQRDATSASMQGQVAPLAAIASTKAPGLGKSPLVEVLPVRGQPSRGRAQGADEPGGSAELASVAAEPLTSGVTVSVMHGHGVSSESRATSQEPTQSAQERQEKHEQKQQQSEEAQREREERDKEREQHKQARVTEREARAREREAQKQNQADHAGGGKEDKGQQEQGEHERTEEEEVGFSAPPPSEEQLRKKRERQEERERVRESHTEEELQVMREERLLRQSERRKAREQAEQ